MTMSRGRLFRGVVTVATAGLSTCNCNGAVDPAPPPLVCSEVAGGEELFATAELNGTTMTVTIYSNVDGDWQDGSVKVTDPMGVTVTSVDPTGAHFELELASPTTTSGSFIFSGTLEDYVGTICPVTRKYTFTIESSDVMLAIARPPLPLSHRDVAQILIADRKGHEVELAAQTGGGRVVWSATGGQVEERGAGKIAWRLPREPGLYQIELVVDHGQSGLSFDTLTLEVT